MHNNQEGEAVASNWQRQNSNNFVGEGNQNDERNSNDEFLLMAGHTNQSHYHGEWYVDSVPQHT